MYDCAKLAPFLDPLEYSLCWSKRKERGKNLEQAKKDGVISFG